MMDTDYSVDGYLQRRTTEELRSILDGYAGRELLPVEEEIVDLILEILQGRMECR